MLDPWSLAQKRWKKRLALALGFRKMLDRAAMFHVLNEDEGHLMRPLRLRPPVTVLPNGVSVDPRRIPLAGSFRARHPEVGDSPYVLFLSRLHPKKGLDYLIGAFAEIARKDSRVRLVIAGPDGGALGSTQRAVRAAGLIERTHFVGPLYDTDKWAALVDATCFCLPSRQEGFSVAILEALACGLPVIISENCHFPEVAAAGAGLVVPLDAGKVAAALAAVLADAGIRERMGRAGRELVESRYTWPRIAADSILMYHRLLQRG
jgi:glycosyltransferase involved in cell wall biosynthesis